MDNAESKLNWKALGIIAIFGISFLTVMSISLSSEITTPTFAQNDKPAEASAMQATVILKALEEEPTHVLYKNTWSKYPDLDKKINFNDWAVFSVCNGKTAVTAPDVLEKTFYIKVAYTDKSLGLKLTPAARCVRRSVQPSPTPAPSAIYPSATSQAPTTRPPSSTPSYSSPSTSTTPYRSY